MGRKIIWTDRAKAQLRAIDQTTALRILHTLARLLATGEGDVKRLQDIGDYRVRFYDFGDGIEVRSVKHRSEAYR
jgi:mRNA-degrading endonuclease RelE of RelBE toxin-antitoxin system